MKGIIFVRLSIGVLIEVCQYLRKPSAKFVHSNLYLWTERTFTFRKAMFKRIDYVWYPQALKWFLYIFF